MPHPSPVNPAGPSDLRGSATPASPTGPASPVTPASPTGPTGPTGPASPSDIVRISLAGLNGTGDTRVDAAVAQLSRLDDAPLEEHPAILGQVHDRLREVLGELSRGDPQRAPGTP